MLDNRNGSLIQYDGENHNIAGKNVIEAFEGSDTVIFNETYFVIGAHTEALKIQKRHNNLDGVNEMPYFKWGLPKTISFGLGIDAMICRYLNLERMSMASNPLGINYVIPDKKRKQENQEDNLLISHQSNNDRNAAIHAILLNLREKKSEK